MKRGPDVGIQNVQCDNAKDHVPHYTPGVKAYCKGVKLTGPRIMFSTIHGSYLYGLDTPGSDVDTFTVTDSAKPKARQTIYADTDSTTVGFNTFMIRALGGSHQSVEALFSPYKVWNPAFEQYKPFIENAVVCGTAVYEKYERTVRKFCFGDFKRRRHAVRLSWNLAGLRHDGRFNPEMTETEREVATHLAKGWEGEDLWWILMEK